MFTVRGLLAVAALAAFGATFPLSAAPASTTAKAIERPPTTAEVAFFEKSIRPVLAGKCYECHSTEAGKSKGGLTLDTRDGIRKGGDSGHAVVPGNVTDSLLLTAIRSTDTDVHMPPKETLPANVIADFEKWVQMGAPDPRDGKTVARKLSPEAAKQFWAFQLPKFVPAPKTANTAWPRSEIDKFILAGLEAKGLKPVGDADRLTLIRRVYFDLIGLPPKPEEIEAFVADRDPRAFEKVVDRLLASPQFGERWGRHWLDVARYAESTGMERNYLYPEAWRYRDYVIAAFNADKPYNQFIREQVAGDLLPSTSVAQRNERLIATGFLAIGPKGLNERNREQFMLDVIDEQIDATTKAVMALTVSCARCHDHKFDPVTMRDYYAMAGIFRSTQTFYPTSQGQGQNRQPSAPLPLAATPADINQRPVTPRPVPAYAKNKKQRQTATPKAALRDSGAGSAMGVLDGHPDNSPIYARGEIEGKGPIVQRGFVQVLSRPGTPGISGTSSGRLELANWLTAPENPLTARAMANRVWLHLFGEGIVRTPDNFGATGEPPTHPELLDHLALRFVASGWSVKNLIRTIVLSRTYQLSGALDAKNYAADPDNRLFWHANQRRLDAEAIRDAMLAIGGQLDLTPPTGPVTTRDMIGAKSGARPYLGASDSNHRSVYLHIVRDLVPPMLELFDFAEPSLVVAERDVTNVPSQALFMLNNSLVLSLSEQAAQRVLTLKDTGLEARITRAYLMTLSRVPTSAEIARAKDFLCISPNPAQGWSTFCQALFASAEFRYLN